MITVSVLVPAYNEAASIITLLEQVHQQAVEGVTFEVLVIDDCSTDNTAALLEGRPDLYTRLLRQQVNGGKGAAVMAGLAVATGDYILFQDADLEYDPSEYPKLLHPVLKFGADVVMGSRMIGPQYIRIHYFWNRTGNQVITLIFNLLFNKTFTDIYSCYLLLRRDLVQPEELHTRGWEQQAELLCKAVQRAKECYEVPISYHGRTYEQGKKIRPIHAVPVILTIIKERLKLLSAPRRQA